MSIKRINSRMLDVLPVEETAEFELDGKNEQQTLQAPVLKAVTYQLGMKFASEEVPVLHEHKIEDKKTDCHLEMRQAQLQAAEMRRRAEKQKLEAQELAAREMEAQRKELAAQKQAAILQARKEAEQQRLLKIEEERKESERLRLAAQAAEMERMRLIKEQELEFEAQRRERERVAEERKQALLAAAELEKAQIKQLQEEAEQRLKEDAEMNRRILAERRQVRIKSEPKDFFNFNWHDLFAPIRFAFGFDSRRSAFSFALVALLLTMGIGGIAFAQKGLALKGKVLGVSQDGYANLTAAAGSLTKQNFDNSSKEFALAYDNFAKASQDLDSLGSVFVDGSRYLPYISKLSSGKNMAEAGKHISAAGQQIGEVVQILATVKNPINTEERSNLSLLDVFVSAQEKVASAKTELAATQKNIDAVNVDDLPKDKQAQFMLLKQKLPVILGTFDEFLNNAYIMADLLGGNGPRKYLFLFQNNTEMRATGGFIGSYGLLDISQGHVRNFFVDGIFNPDGQLKAKIIPPGPIQKISAAWSLHDSNWFPDFPTSAREAINFYEKTGGPTVDGVVTLTPTVMERLLTITGPIEMPDYDVTLTADNFVEKTQYEVEMDYDKTENKPKKILSDLAPLVLEKIVNAKDMKVLLGAAKVLSDGLKEKHILLYSENKDLQKIISAQGWSGEVLPAQKDYLSVINTNINGFKTDAVVEEKIQHAAEIREDGSVVDTVTITRKHNGGNTDYEWWNKVNADYMRVYVPLGSQLIEVSGQTREFDKAPLDYAALGFRKDPLLEKEESTLRVDEETGTRISEDAGKTVFGNWTYVSPGETMTITYKYLLPFKLFQVAFKDDQQVDSYSLVAQKQAGSKGSEFQSQVKFPGSYEVKWNYPENLENEQDAVTLQSDLSSDRFVGLVFEKKE